MNSQMTLAMRLLLDSQQWASGLLRSQNGVKGFVSRTRAELRSLRGEFTGIAGQLAGIGLGFSAVATVVNSARMDKGLTQIRQTAGMTREEIAKLRREMFEMASATGTNVEALQAGFGQLVAGGLEFGQALPTLEAINRTMAVTGSEATTLASALQGAEAHFGFDLSKPGEALRILDQMTVAGRAGVIEIEDLSGAFASSAANARKAGLSFDETLALFEGLGTSTTKERLGTLVDSTLRLFTNDQYRRAAQKATGVSFYNADQSRRGPLEVIQDIQAAYAKLKTDVERDRFIARAFGKTDMDTQKGIAAALGDGKLGEILRIAAEIRGASGTIANDLPEAIDNAVDASGRLKAVMSEAGDRFAQPINRAIVQAIDFLTGKGPGQLDLGGGQLAGLGVAGVLSALLAKRMGARGLDGLLSRFTGSAAGTAAGIGKGKAIEAATGVQPVYVVNASEIGGGALGAAGVAAAGGVAPAAGVRGTALQRIAGAGIAAAVGTEVGGAVYDHALQGTRAGDGIGLYLTRLAAPFSKDAQDALNDEGTGTGRFRQTMGMVFPVLGMLDAYLSADKEPAELEGVVRIEVTDNGTRVRSMESSQPRLALQVNTGRMSAGGAGR